MQNIVWSSGHPLLAEEIVRAEGSYIYDSKGKRYVDLECGVWVTSLGHSHPRINRVIREQSEKIMHTGMCYLNQGLAETSGILLEKTGLGGGKCAFLCSGSEAVEFGVKVMQAIGQKPLLLTMADSFLSSYGSAGGRKKDEWYHFDWMGCGPCPDSRDCESCERSTAIPFEQIGGFVFEPGSSSGHVRFPPPKIIQAFVERIRKNKGFYMANEVTTGIGRTGKWFGFQHYRPQPDIVGMGKSLGNGYPVSAIAVSREVAAQMEEKKFHYNQSHMNDPLGSAVAKEVINIIEEEKLLDRCRMIGGMLLGGLQAVGRKHACIKEVRGRGLMLAVEFSGNPENKIAPRVQRTLFEKGFLVTSSPRADFMRLDPSYTIDEADVGHFLKTFELVMQEFNQ